jgi:putative hydrolase
LPLRGDYHTHTRYSHGRGTIRDNVAQAAALGLEAIAITDHGPGSIFVGLKRGLEQIKDEAKACADEFGIQVLVGLEANIVDLEGHIDIETSIIEELDILLVGLHHWVWPRNLQALCHFYGAVPLGWPGIREKNTEALIGAIRRYPVTCITHPGLKMAIDTAQLACAAVGYGTALEINTSHRQVDVDYIQVAAGTGVDFLINSDAHTPQRVGDFAWGVELVERSGLPWERVRNSWQGKGLP